MSPLPAWAPQGSGAWGAAFLRPTLGGGAGRRHTQAKPQQPGRTGDATEPRTGAQGAPGQPLGVGAQPQRGPSAPALPTAGKSRAKSAGCFGDPGLRGAHAASFSHDLTGRAEPGRWAAPPTPEPEPEPLSGRPPLPAPSAARGHIGPGAGAKPGVPPPRLSPTSRQPQLELALTLHWAWTTSSGDFSLLCPRQPLAAEM